MRIKQLKFTDFRNLASIKLDITDGNNIIALHGDNGAGKTNILEAISLLAPGKGLHNNKPDSHLRQFSDPKQASDSEQANNLEQASLWTVFFQLDEHKVGISYDGHKRIIQIDGEVIKKQSQLSQLGNVVWLTPKMDRLFMDGSQSRRDFLDRLVSGHIPQHSELIYRYRYHIKSRMKLLQSNGDRDWIAIEEEKSAKIAVEITQNRRQYISELHQYLQEVNLTLDGEFEDILANYDIFTLLEKFVVTRQKDAITGQTSFGSHRSNFTGTLLPENISLLQASTGQHKRAVLAIILADARLMHDKTGNTPIILLDEVTSHLDKKVRKKFFKELTELGTQIWLTGTDADLFADTDFSPHSLAIKNGAIV